MSPAPSVAKTTLPPIKSLTGNDTTSPKKEQDSCSPQHQIHSYHKLFWRLNITLEFNIFYHQDRLLYEVAAYHSEKGHEYEPIFLHEEGILRLSAGPEALNAEIEVVKTKLSKDRFNQMPCLEAVIDLAKKSLIKKSLERHLNPTPDGTLTFALLPGESFDLESIVYAPPKEEAYQVDNQNVLPVSQEENTVAVPTVTTVVRRHRSSIHEYNKTLGILKQHSLDLKEASQVAENMLSLSEFSVAAFKSALQNAEGKNRKKSGFYDKKTPLGLFRWAVHRVVLQTYVEAVRKRIEQINKKKLIRINGTFPVPGSTDLQNPAAKMLSLAGRLNASPQMQNLSENLSRECSPRGSGRKEKNVLHSSSLPQL